MTEDFLCYIWQHRLFLPNLFTDGKEKISILSTGERNHNSGPDFFNARIKIGKTIWAGNVEVHLKSSTWNLHKHSLNKAYNNVILHVVYENDTTIKTENGNIIPVIELKNAYNKEAYNIYNSLVENKNYIPCANSLKSVDILIVESTLENLAIERLENKSISIKQILATSKGSWQDCFYQLLAYYFGGNINGYAFELLKKSLDLRILAKHKDNLFQLEALLFGQAGFLNEEFQDEYPALLQKEYYFLRKKYNLKSLDRHLWKFLRLRPNNFPTIRISQFAKLLYKSEHLFSRILEVENINDLVDFFSVSTSDYWYSHYMFDIKSRKIEKKTGVQFIHTLLINVVVPVLFEYGYQHDDQKYKNKALSILGYLPSEKNATIEKWQTYGINAKDSLQSQALIQLSGNYCKFKKCLNCRIGYKVINTK